MTSDKLYAKIQKGDYEEKSPYPQYGEVAKGNITASADREMKNIWREERHTLKLQFKKDLRRYMETGRKKFGNKRWENIWNYVWELGHSAGYDEILGCAIDLAELL